LTLPESLSSFDPTPTHDLRVYDSLSERRSVRPTASNDQYDLTSATNDARGGTVNFIA